MSYTDVDPISRYLIISLLYTGPKWGIPEDVDVSPIGWLVEEKINTQFIFSPLKKHAQYSRPTLSPTKGQGEIQSAEDRPFGIVIVGSLKSALPKWFPKKRT